MFISCLILLLTRNTGKAMPEKFALVMGGELAVIRDYPHTGVMFGRCGPKRSDFMCGSSILNQKILLTAAHCLRRCRINPHRKPFKGHRITVFFGGTLLTNMAVARVIDYIKGHTDWDESQGRNDIGIAMVRKDIPLGDNVKRVMITRRFPNVFHQFFESWVAGWGFTDEGISDHLRQTYQWVRDHKECTKFGKMYDGMFCAGYMEKEGDYPAGGDSGSALVTRKRYHQIGIVSFGWVLYPAMTIYTNVSFHYHWITQNARELYCINTTIL